MQTFYHFVFVFFAVFSQINIVNIFLTMTICWFCVDNSCLCHSAFTLPFLLFTILIRFKDKKKRKKKEEKCMYFIFRLSWLIRDGDANQSYTLFMSNSVKCVFIKYCIHWTESINIDIWSTHVQFILKVNIHQLL